MRKITILTSHFLCIVRVLNQTSDEVAHAFYLDNHDASFIAGGAAAAAAAGGR